MYDIRRFTIPELVEESSARYRGAPALAMLGGPTIRYEELEPRTRRLAALLFLLGARHGDRVAILAESRPEWGLAYLALSRAGCVAVPLLPDFPAGQVAGILDHSGSRILLVSKRFEDKLAAEAAKGRTLLRLEGFELLSAPEGLGPPGAEALDEAALRLPEVRADDLAAIVYTSGTTGSSKGVMLTHRNLVHDAWSVSFIMRIGRRDRLLSILPLAHTYEFTVGFLYPLMQGASITYLGRPPSAPVLLPALKALRPTTMLTVPLIIEKTYFGSIRPALDAMPLSGSPFVGPILERLAGARLKRSFGGRLRIFGIGGAPLAPETEAFLRRIRFPCAMGYGLTETSPLIAGSSPRGFRPGSIGPAVHGAELRIADPRPGTGEGEIQARGPNVMAGYYKDEERTREAFTADGWFRTGDLGTMDERGRVSVRGRIKTVILGASGENIYPEEIEALLNTSPYVAESLVYGDERGLTALVHLKPEALESLRSRVRGEIEEIEGTLAQMLEQIKREANARLAAFSRLARVELQAEPFEKTPKQSIKRFLYPTKRQ